MSETWALCGICERWYYVTSGGECCPVCQSPAVALRTEQAEMDGAA